MEEFKFKYIRKLEDLSFMFLLRMGKKPDSLLGFIVLINMQ